MLDPNCLFCKIIEKKISAHVIYEDDHAVAFLDIMPRTIGHTIVIPKVHAANLLSLPDEELEPLFAAVKKTDELLSRSLACDGMTIGINQGRVSGQEVDHLHIHLMPRFQGDGGSAVQSLVSNAPQESAEVIKERIISKSFR
jgi:histidine triad (HIT) family protein